MANKPSKVLQVLAQNLERLMGASKEFPNAVAVGKKAKIDQKTVWRILNTQNEPSIDKVERIAGVFGLQPWQLLVPGLDPATVPVLAEHREAEAVS